MDVMSLGLSPMKGTRHLAVPSLSLDRDGPVGDREFCLVDPERRGVIRTVQHPELVGADVSRLPEGLRVQVPGQSALTMGAAAPRGFLDVEYWGRRIRVELLSDELSELFSAFLGRPVLFARAQRGDVVYGDHITITASASLAELGSDADHRRFRSAVHLRTDVPWAEEGWCGRTAQLGSATVTLGGAVPRCAVIDVDPQTGERNGDLLRRLAGRGLAMHTGEPVFGAYARVRRGGTVHLGSPFRLL
ncbi:MOSC N-terminal beta barrel domain-containing protein [Nesterenkonia sp. NBAIMH1]|uniref:MOSC N-terminal beta barrel domain-containing protein n=1 Tax=Nesterenkonia sp. NBAIMH1 TaxID=2600320 RepID=UPI00143D20C5|nr:MOSC N-terminal beta barrel domain-containing protein [Nesterenkonia sp. NBAIMH1]